MEQSKQPPRYGARSSSQIREHYEIEKRLAKQLREASKSDRQRLYSELYDELFQCVPFHPLLTRKTDPTARERNIRGHMQILKRFLSPSTTYAEIGPGDCTVAIEVAKHVKHVYAVDVSEEVTRLAEAPSNFELIISDGTSVPVPPGSVDVAFSNQLMEHLHPEDAPEQLHNIFRALAPGGVYICMTPSGWTGPHDVSRYFDDVATGFHLKEYTTTELHQLFRASGFSRFNVFVKGGTYVVMLPILPVLLIEAVLGRMPRARSKQLARKMPIRKLLDKIVAYKDANA